MKASNKQSDHWLDQLVSEIGDWANQHKLKKVHVDDMKTPSGRVHTGALRGVVLHDLVAKAVEEKVSQEVVSTYVINDMDPMDGLPSYLSADEYSKHMGKPLFQIPAPTFEDSGINFSHSSKEDIKQFKEADSFAQFYALDFINAFRAIGCDQKVIWSHELYQSGVMNDLIRTALDNVDKIKQVYQEVAEYDLPENWYPFQVICPVCGKVGTTLVTDWDGEEVSFSCLPDKVDWARGCGHQDKISPFNGTGKLLWKVDWPAHWVAMGVNVEGAGKDHTSAGGSRDMADALMTNVFDSLVPFDIPYEWIMVRGAKMSSSKGVGTSAREFVELFPSEVGRFLFVSKHYNSVIDFDPHTMAIPDLFDQYDQGARIFWKQEDGDERIGRSFELSQINEVPKPYFLPRFRDIVTWMQDPKINLVEKFAEVKGSKLTELEKNELELRKKCAEIWLERHAPDEVKLVVVSELSDEVSSFDDSQKEFLANLNELIESQDWQPEDLQQQIFDLAKSSIGARKGFQTIYLSFLGKKAGPKAAWLLLDLDPKMRKERFEEIINS